MSGGLERFVRAQERSYDRALAELRAGRKTSHWIWYVFPQIAGLGHSYNSKLYAIASLEEARAYLAHPVLGPRLRTCVEAMLAHAGRDARDILGRPDDWKFRSCLTLFEAAEPGEPLFRQALDAFFGGREDGRTLARLEAAS